jgi:predicted nucleotidyltransferase
MTLEGLRRDKRNEILRVAGQYGASNVRVFGYVARGSATGRSDVDLLVDFAPERSLLDQIGLTSTADSLAANRGNARCADP